LQNIALVYFRFWKEHLDTVRVFKKSDLLFLLLLKFNEYLPQIHRIVHQDTPEHWGEDELTYALIFSAGGFWNILNKWLEDGAVKTPEELAGIIQTALRNIR
jgi:hypothetical protein